MGRHLETGRCELVGNGKRSGDSAQLQDRLPIRIYRSDATGVIAAVPTKVPGLPAGDYQAALAASQSDGCAADAQEPDFPISGDWPRYPTAVLA